MGVNILTEFLQLLVGGITTIGAGIGEGVNAFVTDLFLVTEVVDGVETQHLSQFGALVAIFGGIGLCIGLTTLVFNWIRSIGN